MRLNDYKALQDFLWKGAAVIALAWDKKQSKAWGPLGSGPGWAKVSPCTAVLGVMHWEKQQCWCRLLSAMCPGRCQESLRVECAYWCFATTRALWKTGGPLLNEHRLERSFWYLFSSLVCWAFIGVIAALSTAQGGSQCLTGDSPKLCSTDKTQPATLAKHKAFFQLLYLMCFACQLRWNMFLPDKTNSYSNTEREGELKGSKPSIVRGLKSEVQGLNNIISEYYVTIQTRKTCPVSWRTVIMPSIY